MNNSWLGGPVRTLAAIVFITSLANIASAEAVAWGVKAEMPPTAASVIAEQTATADESGLLFEMATSGPEAHAHLQIMGDRPGRYELAFDVQIGLPPIHQESSMPRALFDDGHSAAGMLLRVDPRAHALTGSLSIEIRNLDDGSEIKFDLDYEDPVFELLLEDGMYSILIRGTVDGAPNIDEDRAISRIPAPATLLLAAPLAACFRRRRQ